MTETFTQTDILRYVYGETNESENIQIESAIVQDAQLAEFYYEIADMSDRINKTIMKPSDRCIVEIMSKASAVHV